MFRSCSRCSRGELLAVEFSTDSVLTEERTVGSYYLRLLELIFDRS